MELKVAKGAMAALVGWVLGLHAAIQVLFILIVCDVLTGTAMAIGERRVSSAVSRRGLTKKAVMVILVMTAHYVGQMTGIGIDMPPFGELDVGAAVAVFFSLSEAISIIENTQRYVPYPQWVVQRLMEAAKMEGSVGAKRRQS